MIRQPVVAFVGHVDHGKSSLLQHIAGVSITKGEAGGITQIIKAYTVPLEQIKKICGKLLGEKQNINIPGILFIDTPGHAAFTSLRKRGGNLADIAILVVDINEGIKPQTLEALEILKHYKTPFIIALNKIDALGGWKIQKDKTLLANIATQTQQTQLVLDQKLYEILGTFYEHGIKCERFDRVDNYATTVAMVPVSAKTEEGMPELLMILTGLTQKYLENSLRIEVSGAGKGTILEIHDIKGFGTTLDVIIHDGTIKTNDTIVIGGLTGAVTTKVRGLQVQTKSTYDSVKEASAASSLRIIAPNIKDAIPGMPLIVANTNTQDAIDLVQKEISEALIDTQNEGITLKADSLGSLEALIVLLKEHNIPIRSASIGSISKKDIASAASAKEEIHKVILAFNLPDGTDDKIHIIHSNIIYKILDDYDSWKAGLKKELELRELEGLPKLAKIQILPHCVFRQSNPAIVGVRVLGGILYVGTPLMKDDKELTTVKEIQVEKENTTTAKTGEEAAIALPGITMGRQLHEGDYLLTSLSESEFMALKKAKSFLKPSEVELLKEIAEHKRKTNTLWGM